MKKVFLIILYAAPVLNSCNLNSQQQENQKTIIDDVSKPNIMNGHPIIGSWGNYHVSSGYSLGAVYDFKNDGTYSLLTVFESETFHNKLVTNFKGKYQVDGNKIRLIPDDWHIQKMDSDGHVIEERHEKRELETMYWRIEFNQQEKRDYLYIDKEEGSTVGYARQ
ncbi:MAG TPA: hypothetical protein VFH08_19800 [Chitinophagaceae bacterium]|nr:hypothetical protein [Chitinophagaceae bacterium]